MVFPRGMLRSGLPWWSVVKNPPARAGDAGLLSRLEDPLEKEKQPTPVFLSGKSHGQRSLAGYSPWGQKELNTTEWLNNIPWSGIIGSFGNFIFVFLRNFHTLLCSVCIDFHSHQQCRKIPFSLHPLQNFFADVLMMAVLTAMMAVGWDDTYCSFTLHHSNNKWWWASFHMPLGLLCVFFGVTSV